MRKTAEFLLYFVTLMVYMGIASLFGFDLFGFESNWVVLVYLLVLTPLPASRELRAFALEQAQ